MNLFAADSTASGHDGLEWNREPPEWRIDAQGRLHVTPAAATDFFRPIDGPGNDNAALFAVPVSGDFTARTYASASLVGFGDAAALSVRVDHQQWAKICIERSPAGEVAIVSVVTDPWSDDANNELLERPEAHLRITRKGSLFGMHYSLDGERWRFVRAFGLAAPAQIHVGVHAQAPFVGGCSARFDHLAIDDTPVADFRSGD